MYKRNRVYRLKIDWHFLNGKTVNDVKEEESKFEGVYIFQDYINGGQYWVDAEAENAIWYDVDDDDEEDDEDDEDDEDEEDENEEDEDEIRKFYEIFSENPIFLTDVTLAIEDTDEDDEDDEDDNEDLTDVTLVSVDTY